jgi:hypothetical protein
MPKIPFKRNAASDPAVLDSYIPPQVVDYTVLPPLEDQDTQAGFERLPLPLRIAALLLPLVLVIGGVLLLWRSLTAAPAAQVPLSPSVSITSARVVSRDAIVVEARTQHVADGAPVQAQVLANGEPVNWLDSTTLTTTVQQNRIALRLQKAADAKKSLDPQAAYRIDLSVGDAATPATSQADLAVPFQLASAFFVLATPTPVQATPLPAPTVASTSQLATEFTPTPTAQPASQSAQSTPKSTAQSTPKPTPTSTTEKLASSGVLTLEVRSDATVLISPTLGSSVIGSMARGSKVRPLMRTDDSTWFLVRHMGNQFGWLPARYVKQDEDVIDQIPSVKPPTSKVQAGPLKAQVFHGGNIRYTPDKRRGTVLGQMHAHQTVTLLQKTADGQWYKVVAPEAEGWVHVSLLTIPRGTASKVPNSR